MMDSINKLPQMQCDYFNPKLSLTNDNFARWAKKA